MTDLYAVRVVFTHDGQRLHEFVGPFDPTDAALSLEGKLQ